MIIKEEGIFASFDYFNCWYYWFSKDCSYTFG